MSFTKSFQTTLDNDKDRIITKKQKSGIEEKNVQRTLTGMNMKIQDFEMMSKMGYLPFKIAFL